MPLLKDWMCETVGISLDHKTPAQPELTAADIPTPVLNEEFISGVKKMGISYTDDPHDRLFRAHGNQKIKTMEGYGESFVIVIKYIDTLNIQKLV